MLFFIYVQIFFGNDFAKPDIIGD